MRVVLRVGFVAGVTAAPWAHAVDPSAPCEAAARERYMRAVQALAQVSDTVLLMKDLGGQLDRDLAECGVDLGEKAAEPELRQSAHILYRTAPDVSQPVPLPSGPDLEACRAALRVGLYEFHRVGDRDIRDRAVTAFKNCRRGLDVQPLVSGPGPRDRVRSLSTGEALP